jgi:hypothetical protein
VASPSVVAAASAVAPLVADPWAVVAAAAVVVAAVVAYW